MKTEYTLLISVLTQLMMPSCVDPIQFEANSTMDELVFYGEFSQLNETHFINISRTSEFEVPAAPEGGADVMIFDNLGNSACFSEKEIGRYELMPGDFTGIIGRFYHLEITLANGMVFTSLPQELLPPINIEDIYFRIEPEQVPSESGNPIDQIFINIYIDTPLPSFESSSGGVRWLVEEAYSFTDLQCHPFFDFANTCYFRIPVDDTEVKLFGTKSRQQYLEGYQVHSRILAPDDEFLERHYFTVYQKNIDKEAYDYWERIEVVANQSGDLFDQPPGRVVGNIFEKENPDELALGYFEVSGKSISRVYTLPFLIGGDYITETCPERRNFIIEDKCCFCQLLDEPENRIERPNYWAD